MGVRGKERKFLHHGTRAMCLLMQGEVWRTEQAEISWNHLEHPGRILRNSRLRTWRSDRVRPDV